MFMKVTSIRLVIVITYLFCLQNVYAENSLRKYSTQSIKVDINLSKKKFDRQFKYRKRDISRKNFHPLKFDYPLNNPHTGFVLWGSNVKVDGDLPNNYYNASIYHIYIPWRVAEPKDQVFNWSEIESTYFKPIIDRNPNATFIIRPVADYPNATRSNINYWYKNTDKNRDYPIFFHNVNNNIKRNDYYKCNQDGPGVAPDWNDSNFIKQAEEFITALGKQYDGDPRITAVQMGIIGMWGEWHQSGCPELKPKAKVKNAVAAAYANAFKVTPIQTRYVGRHVENVDSGFYEDYFPSYTGNCQIGIPDCNDEGSWNLEWGYSNLVPKAREYWKKHPISGESPLDEQKNTWIDDRQPKIIDLIRKYHFSFLGPAGKHQELGYEDELSIIKANLGYRVQLDSITLPSKVHNDVMELSLGVSQVGVAPMYFPANIAIDWLYSDHQSGNAITETTILPYEINKLLPGEQSVLTFDVPLTGKLANEDGVYDLRLYMVHPNQDNRKIAFANEGLDKYKRLPIGGVSIVRGRSQ